MTSESGPIYAVGDVHGHADKLAAIHALIRRDLGDRDPAHALLVHLGDFIDRGPNSAGVLALLTAGPPVPGLPTVNLIGNHEAMLLAALDHSHTDAAGLWLQNGGAATLESWRIDPAAPVRDWAEQVPPHHLAFLRALPLHHTAGTYTFVHAGVRPGIELARQREEDLLWIREPFLYRNGPMLPEAPQRIIVHGHTPHPTPDLRRNRIGIDTGAGAGHALTCAVLGDGPPRFLQA